MVATREWLVGTELDLLTPAEAAQVLRVSRNYLYQKLRNGDIPSIRVGKLYRIPRSVLVERTKPE